MDILDSGNRIAKFTTSLEVSHNTIVTVGNNIKRGDDTSGAWLLT